MPKQNEQQNIQIARLEEKVDAIQNRIDRFIDNDFKHLKEKVEGIESKLLWGFLFMIASTLILQIILKFFK